MRNPIRLCVSILALLIFNCSIAKQVLEETAKTVATNFLFSQGVLQSKSSKNVQKVFQSQFTIQSAKQNAFYVFNTTDSGGFVIVAGDDRIKPILGYTQEGVFDFSNLPRGLAKLMFEYKKGIREIVAQNHQPSELTIDKWANLIKEAYLAEKSATVGPLTETTWSQRPYYNVDFPDNSPSGCVATCVAQIMKYHNHPIKGEGQSSYNHSNYGTLSANHAEKTFNWTQMPNSLSYYSSQEEKEEISDLMWHIGVSINMNYGPDGSGAYPYRVRYALQDHFGYKKTMSHIYRSSYSLEGWQNIMKDELDQSRVVFHAGFCPDPEAGHAFVIDGYDQDDLFHVNWGWSGSYDGWFEINNLNPGGTYTWNQGQSAIIGITPDEKEAKIAMQGDIFIQKDSTVVVPDTLNPDTINIEESFYVHLHLGNIGNDDFKGSIWAIASDTSGNRIDTLGTFDSLDLDAFSNMGVAFPLQGRADFLPGLYKVHFYSKSYGNNETRIEPEGYVDSYTFYHLNHQDTIIDTTSYPNTLISWSHIQVDPEVIKIGEAFQVEVEVFNNRDTDFSGYISVDFHDLSNNWLSEIDYTFANINAGESKTLTFTTSAPQEDAGTYKVAMWSYEGNWNPVYEGKAPNTKEVIIAYETFSNLNLDIYEPNDNIEDAYRLPFVFENFQAYTDIQEANIHQVGNEDYYVLELESGYDYQIQLSGIDYYNDESEQFTNDIILTYGVNGVWSGEYFDGSDVPTIKVVNGGELQIKVISFFHNDDIGTYSLLARGSRTSTSNTVSVKENAASSVLIYPNPSSGQFSVFSPESGYMTLLNMQGETVLESEVQGNNKKVISFSTPGCYFLSLQTSSGLINKRIIIK